jgi:hypothetical protein
MPSLFLTLEGLLWLFVAILTFSGCRHVIAKYREKTR